MNHKLTLLISIAVVAFYSCSPKQEPASSPNIVCLLAEDIGPAFGCYGDSYATTPNIDRLAAGGMVYDFALTTAPICAPSRSCLATGLYATSMGTQHLRCEVAFPEVLKTVPELLRQKGYFTSNRDKTDYNFDPKGRWEHWSSEITPWRHRANGQAFYSFINIGPSHEGSVNNLKTYEGFVKDLPKELFHDPAKVKLPPYYPDSPKTKGTWAHYYDILTVLDKNIGAVLDSLKADGLMDETIVFIMADHGFGMPRYKRWLNITGMRVPLVVHVPEKYRHMVPGFSEGGHFSKMVSYVDIPATILNLAGVPIPDYFEGKPIMGENAVSERKLAFGARDRADDMYEMSRSVTDGKYMYIRHFMPHLAYIQPGYIFSDEKEAYKELRRLHLAGQTNAEQEKLWNKKPVEEFYDLKNDPAELKNLADHPNFSEIKENLKKELYTWMVEKCDLGLLPEAEYMIRSEGSTPYEYARFSGNYHPEKILEAAEMVGVASETVLIEKLNDEDSGVRYWAVIGLEQFDKLEPASLTAITKLLADPSPSVQIVAAEVLCNNGETKDAVKVLEKWVSDDRPWLALQAARTILLVGEAARPLIPTMYKVLEKNLGEPGKALKYKDFNFAAFTSWSLEWALKELGEPVKLN